jgi:Ribosomal protein L10
MPSAKILEQKQAVVAQLNEKLNAAVAGVLVDYKGISVENDTKLRRELRAAGVDYSVVKNSLLRRACESTAYAGLDSVLSGTTALALSNDDAVAAAKVLAKYAAGSKGAFKIKAGFVEGKVLDAAEVDTLAKLPSREELIAKTLGGLNAPITGFVNVLNGNIRGLVIALNQIAEQKTA